MYVCARALYVCVVRVRACVRVTDVNWGSKYQQSMSHIVSKGTLGAHTLTCETWYSLLWVLVRFSGVD